MISNLPRLKQRKSNVIPINQPESISPSGPKVIASDEVTNRIIIAIGSQRLAYDFSTRITELPPTAGAGSPAEEAQGEMKTYGKIRHSRERDR